ncbi:MAG: flagellar biosynthesis protein FliQ [Lachnoclostridium sp.]|jgi:flagellar biosynthetic protein FliQ|nr:flagellar biosynthesis protein FliQ [Lachnoclostridium sp.]
MDETMALDVVREAIWLIILVSAPLLLVSLVVGLVISVFQTVTSIQEQTLTFVPKLLAIFLILMLFGSWIMGTMVEFLVVLCDNFVNYV